MNFKKTLDREIFRKPCLVIKILVYLFVFGYITFLMYLIRDINSQSPNELLVSVIFFFGAVFVVIVLKINNQLLSSLVEKSVNLQKLNEDLKIRNQDLIQKSKALIISEKKYKDQTNELEKTLDDFYTMRLGMEKQMKEGTLEEENKKIKDRIDTLNKE